MKRVALALIILSAFSLAASAETIRGVVHNGTTNRPSAGDEVTLKKIGNGMEEVGKTKSNAKGEFSFTVPDSGRQPYLLWVAHQEVTYTKVAMPGSGTIAVQVFNASSTVKDITLQEHMMVLQTSPDGNTLKVDALFTLANQSSPPLTKNGQHTFEIYLPDNAKVVEATAQSAGNMALKTSVVPTGEKNKFFFGYPLRPGQTQFRIGYSLPYTGKLNLNPKLTIPTTSMLVVTPTSFKFVPEDGSVYSPQTNEQIKNVVLYVAKDLKPESKVGFQIEGTGELPREQAGGGNDAGEGGQPAGEPNRPGGGLGVPNTQPDPLHNGQWLFLGVLTVFLSAGAVYVYTAKPVEVVVSGKRGKKVRERSSSTLLDAMKEELFQLESDRVEGKITPEEYESSKAALDKTLQRAVKRQAMAK